MLLDNNNQRYTETKEGRNEGDSRQEDDTVKAEEHVTRNALAAEAILSI